MRFWKSMVVVFLGGTGLACVSSPQADSESGSQAVERGPSAAPSDPARPGAAAAADAIPDPDTDFSDRTLEVLQPLTAWRVQVPANTFATAEFANGAPSDARLEFNTSLADPPIGQDRCEIYGRWTSQDDSITIPAGTSVRLSKGSSRPTNLWGAYNPNLSLVVATIFLHEEGTGPLAIKCFRFERTFEDASAHRFTFKRVLAAFNGSGAPRIAIKKD